MPSGKSIKAIVVNLWNFKSFNLCMNSILSFIFQTFEQTRRTQSDKQSRPVQ